MFEKASQIGFSNEDVESKLGFNITVLQRNIQFTVFAIPLFDEQCSQTSSELSTPQLPICP